MLCQLIHGCDASQSQRDIVFWQLTKQLRCINLSKTFIWTTTQRSFTSPFTDSLHTLGNKPLQKYIGIMGHVNYCRFTVLLAFSFTPCCTIQMLSCFLVAHWYHDLDIITSGGVHLNWDLHNSNGAYIFYTYWYIVSISVFSDCLCKVNLLFFYQYRPRVCSHLAKTAKMLIWYGGTTA